jgi:hypothetical protein
MRRAVVTGSAGRRLPVYGPEPWRERAKVTWSWWDVWFCAVVVGDHGGDLDALETWLAGELRTRVEGREATEAKLSHLADLRARLADASLDPGDLASSEVCPDRALMAKARKKVGDQWIEARALTPAMRETPRQRLQDRARRGHWAAFPVSPQAFYERFRTFVEGRDVVTERATFSRVRRLEERIERLDAACRNEAQRLALHRGFHTAGLVLADRADDSLGYVGDLREQYWQIYLGVGWRNAGMAPEDYWQDLCELVVWEAYGLGYQDPVRPYQRIGPGEADLAEGILLGLEVEHRGMHLGYQADEALSQLAWLQVARRRFSHYEAAAARLGSRSWQPVVAMAESALRSERRDLAMAVFRAADQPGVHQQHLRVRRRALIGET